MTPDANPNYPKQTQILTPLNPKPHPKQTQTLNNPKVECPKTQTHSTTSETLKPQRPDPKFLFVCFLPRQFLRWDSKKSTHGRPLSAAEQIVFRL